MGKLGPNLPKFEVFGQLSKFKSLNFSDFANFNRQTQYLTDNGRLVAEKKNLRPNLITKIPKTKGEEVSGWKRFRRENFKGYRIIAYNSYNVS